MDKYDLSRPPAVIAGAFQTGVLGVRSLKRKGIETCCFDCNPAMNGFYSTYGPAKLCPNPDIEPAAWLDFMKNLAGEMRSKPVLIPSSDLYVTAIAKARDVLKDYYILNPGVETQALLAEKQTQYKMAFEHGMPMPLTQMIGDMEELERLATKISYPCLIKPWHFREWESFPPGHPLYYKKVYVANNQGELLDGYRMAETINPNVVIQEIILGADTNKRVYLSCYDANGARIARAMFRELRCVPFQFGPASVSEPYVDEEADQICNHFLQKINYKGICEIEVKRDDRDGKVKLIEANPRLSGGGDAAPYAGVDLCWIHYRDLIGEKVDLVEPNDRKFRHIVFKAEGTAIPQYMKAGLLTWRELLANYKPPVAFFDLDIRDWRNSLGTFVVTVRLLIQAIFQKTSRD